MKTLVELLEPLIGTFVVVGYNSAHYSSGYLICGVLLSANQYGVKIKYHVAPYDYDLTALIRYQDIEYIVKHTPIKAITNDL